MAINKNGFAKYLAFSTSIPVLIYPSTTILFVPVTALIGVVTTSATTSVGISHNWVLGVRFDCVAKLEIWMEVDGCSFACC